jgi:hypothetical protein
LLRRATLASEGDVDEAMPWRTEMGAPKNCARRQGDCLIAWHDAVFGLPWRRAKIKPARTFNALHRARGRGM